MSKFTLNPYTVVRVCTLPLSSLDRLRFQHTLTLVSLIQEKEQLINGISVELCNYFYSLVPTASDNNFRRSLIQAQRDLHNRRDSSIWSSSLRSYLSLEGIRKLDSYQNAIKSFEFLKKQYLDTYTREKKDVALFLLELLEVPEIKSTIPLATQALLPSLSELSVYAKQSSIQLNRREQKALDTLNSYVTRAVTRSTPFGEFVTVVAGLFNDRELSHSASWTVKNQLQINRSLLPKILSLLFSSTSFLKQAKYSLNPLIIKNEERVFFYGLDNQGNEKLKYLIENSHIKDLINTYSEKWGSITVADNDELSIETLNLIKNGFIKLEINSFSSDMNWVKYLCDLIQPVHQSSKILNIIFLLLSRSEIIIQQFINSSPKTRNILIKQLQEAWQASFELIKSEYTQESSNLNLHQEFPLVFLDRGSSERLMLDHKSHVSAFESLCTWIKLTGHLSWHRVENAAMRHFFDQYYEEKNQNVSFGNFFRDYYLGFLQKIISLNTTKLEDFSLSQFSKNLEIKGMRNQLDELLISKWNESQEAINLIAEDLYFLSQSGKSLPSHHTSVSAFIFPLKNGMIALSQGSYQQGHGKYWSRFLSILDPEIMKSTQKLLRSTSNSILAEIRGGDSFTGNIHPVLTDTIIAVPGQWNSIYRKCNILQLSDLLVVRENNSDLSLYSSSSNKKVIPLDLGFLDVRQASPVRRILTCFSPHWEFSLQPPWSFKKNKVIFRPQIVLNGNLILLPCSWLVPGIEITKFLQNKDEEARFFQDIYCWRKEYNIPNSVFVRLYLVDDISVRSPFFHNSSYDDRSLMAWRQPQYIDFQNPFSISKLRKLCSKISKKASKYCLQIEEAYVNSVDKLSWNNDRFVEYTVQIEWNQTQQV